MSNWNRIVSHAAPVAAAMMSSITGGDALAGTLPCEIVKRVPTDVGAADSFGQSVEIDGDVAIVGAPFNGSMGAAYIYRRQGVDWVEDQKLLPFDVPPGMLFFSMGEHVDVAGDVAIVSGDGLDGDFNDASRVLVYRYDPGTQTWNNERALTVADVDTVDGELFQGQAAIGDGVLAVAYSELGPGGHTVLADVFRYDSNTSNWLPESTRLAIGDPALAQNGFGTMLSLTDSVLAAATIHVDGSTRTGKVFLHRYDGTGWASDGTISRPGSQSDDEFGLAAAVSGDRLAVGAPKFDHVTAGIDAGVVYTYQYSGSSWGLSETITPDDHDAADQFGSRVALDGDTLLVGVPLDDELGVFTESGSAYLFRPGELAGFVQTAKVKASDASHFDHFGQVAVSGDYALVGAPDEDAGGGGAGAAYFFGGVSGADCDGNGQLDVCEILGAPALDDDGDGVIDACELLGDVNNDGVVNVQDLLQLLGAWGPCPEGLPAPPCPEDLNGDGQVNVVDLLDLLGNWS